MENLIGQFAQDDLSLTSLLVNLAIGTVLSLVLKLHFLLALFVTPVIIGTSVNG